MYEDIFAPIHVADEAEPFVGIVKLDDSLHLTNYWPVVGRARRLATWRPPALWGRTNLQNLRDIGTLFTRLDDHLYCRTLRNCPVARGLQLPDVEKGLSAVGSLGQIRIPCRN